MPTFGSFAPLLVASGLLLMLTTPAARAESMMNQIIFKKCSTAMQSDFEKAGKTAADGLVSKTCNCVVEQIKATHNIKLARSICTKQAQQN